MLRCGVPGQGREGWTRTHTASHLFQARRFPDWEAWFCSSFGGWEGNWLGTEGEYRGMGLTIRDVSQKARSCRLHPCPLEQGL